MCGICKTVECIRRRLFGSCECEHHHRRCCEQFRYSEPVTRITCANQQSKNFVPCCDDDDCRCKKHNCNDFCD